MQPIEFIRNTPPFDRLSGEEVHHVAGALKIVRYPAGVRILQQQGEPSHYLYVIREGAVRLERDGRPVMVMEEGELFGFPSMLGQRPPLFDVVTEETSLMYQIPEELFRRLLQNARFAEFFLQGLGERLRRTAVLEPRAAWGDITTPVRHLVRHKPIFVEADQSVAHAAQVMHEANISSVLVRADPPGIVTTRDLRSRVLAQARSPETPVCQVMSAPLKTLPADTPVYGAMLFLIQEHIHHLPLEADGQIVASSPTAICCATRSKTHSICSSA
ncbi:MAG: cyclic nucleotide-binding domain-containing protein [Ardenticatenia bacterium]|nr:cyclic nucleotide-binding domain-containing protein [Ardenticatenia bacterium]